MKRMKKTAEVVELNVAMPMTRDCVSDIRAIITEARQSVVRHVNNTMTLAYWLIGRRLVVEEQKGGRRAAYGEHLLERISRELTAEFGRGFAEPQLRNCRLFYQAYPTESAIRYALRIKLSWTHHRAIMRVGDPKAREYYLREASERNLSARDIEREIRNMAYQRIMANQTLVGRQVRVPTETTEKYIDFVFYNYILKCFVLVDLKTARLTSRDIGQMDTYRRMYDALIKPKEDQPTIGILLGTEVDETDVEYSVMSECKRMFATKLLPYMPTKAELQFEIERARCRRIR